MNQGLRRGVRTVSWTRVLPPRARQGPIHRGWQARGIQIRAAASEQPATVNGENIPITSTPNSAESRGMLHDSGFPEAVRLLHGRSCMLTRSKKIDARFDVIGAPYSLLSVSLSASQNLYTRRGTLVGLSGKADNVCGYQEFFCQD